MFVMSSIEEEHRALYTQAMNKEPSTGMSYGTSGLPSGNGQSTLKV